jgi:hypothetical protein
VIKLDNLSPNNTQKTKLDQIEDAGGDEKDADEQENKIESPDQ